MIGFRDLLESLMMGGVGGAVKGAAKQATQPQNNRLKIHGMNVVNGGGRSNINRPELLQYRRPMQYAQRKPMQDPARELYPNRTNYGVPQDNMIDTSMGYLTDDQFNQGFTGQYQGSNPYIEDLDTRFKLRVR